MYALINSQIYTGNNILIDHAVVISGNVIQAVCPTWQLSNRIKTYDLSGLIVSPGFIDLHINGCGGVQFNDSMQFISINTLEIMRITNQRFGCTSFLPTLITSNDWLIQKAVEVIRIFLFNNHNQVLGLHLEGPFINPKRKGIHNSNLIRMPTQKMIDYLCSNSDIIKKITLAPEQLLDSTIIKKLKKSGICVSIGHSDATYRETLLGFSSGVTCGTHLFNAMSPAVAREPGVIGAIFDIPEIYCSIIADGIHVDWVNIKYAKKIKKDKLFLVTDGTSPSGTKKITRFVFAGKTIFYKNKVCADKSGILGGSSLTMIQAIHNIVKYANVPLDEALRMATLYPAQIIGIDHYLGSLEANKIANIAVFNPQFEVKKTIVNGKICTIET